MSYNLNIKKKKGKNKEIKKDVSVDTPFLF
jgi:hypothetical protein